MPRTAFPCIRRLPIVAGVVAAAFLAACSDDGTPTPPPVESPTLTATSGPATSTPRTPTATATSSPATPIATETAIVLPTAPESARVDTGTPVFSNPTSIDNPLFPISNLETAILAGHVDDRPFRTETTLLPATKTITVDGKPLEARVSQYMAYLDGRIEEVAVDLYAQDDAGNVWYLGEDVFNYADGAVADTNGTWLAGREGPPAMIMPANPQVGDVYRPENAPGIVFEEVTVRQTGVSVDGPTGRIEGAIIAHELHMDGTTEDKTFAPGYGEFSTGDATTDLESLAIAIPTDFAGGEAAPELGEMVDAARGIAAGDDRRAVFDTAWSAYQAAHPVPALLAQEIELRLADLDAGADPDAGDPGLRLALAALDLQLQYRPVTDVNRDRFDIWLQQLAIDAEGGVDAGVSGDAITLRWIWDRFAHTLSAQSQSEGSALLDALTAAVEAGDLAAATSTGDQLKALLQG